MYLIFSNNMYFDLGKTWSVIGVAETVDNALDLIELEIQGSISESFLSEDDKNRIRSLKETKRKIRETNFVLVKTDKNSLVSHYEGA